ncbi:hypothetical protein GCM10027184_41920 [Saccharothrix stipae]
MILKNRETARGEGCAELPIRSGRGGSHQLNGATNGRRGAHRAEGLRLPAGARGPPRRFVAHELRADVDPELVRALPSYRRPPTGEARSARAAGDLVRPMPTPNG